MRRLGFQLEAFWRQAGALFAPLQKDSLKYFDIIFEIISLVRTPAGNGATIAGQKYLKNKNPPIQD
jgi:hypothetical protein